MNVNDTNPSNRDLPPVTPDEVSRRKFFTGLSIILASVSALALATPMIGFIIGPLFRRRPAEWRSVGKVDSFQIGKTVAVRYEDASPEPWAGVTARTAAWLRRESKDEFIAFSINCSHLGCPVRWLAEADLFMCPCHGGVYYKDGTVAAGPPPRPLTRYAVRIRNGEVEIQTGPIPIA